MSLRDQPYLPLYVQDFLTDEKLNECSALACGVYIKLMCLMHKSEEYGTILLRQKDKQTACQITNFATKLVKHLPYPIEDIIKGIIELTTEGCLKIEGDKLLQKRMISDNKISLIRKESGSKGGFAKAKRVAKRVAKGVANTEYENENEIVSDNVINVKKVSGEIKPLIPELYEFISYCKSLSIYDPSMDFQIEAKYNAWVEDKWRDGNNKPIKNWKTKIQNTMPYFKRGNNGTNNKNGGASPDFLRELVNKRAAKERG